MIIFTRLSPFFRFFTRAHGESLGTRLVASMHLLTAFYGISIYRSQITASLQDLFPPEDVKHIKLKNALTNCIDFHGNFTVTTVEVIAWFPGFFPAFSDAVQLCSMLGAWLYALNVHGVQLSPPPALLSHVYPRDRAHIKTCQALLLLT